MMETAAGIKSKTKTEKNFTSVAICRGGLPSKKKITTDQNLRVINQMKEVFEI